MMVGGLTSQQHASVYTHGHDGGGNGDGHDGGGNGDGHEWWW